MASYTITFTVVGAYGDAGDSKMISIENVHDEIASLENPNTIVSPKEIVVMLDSETVNRPAKIKLISVNPGGFTRAGIARAMSRLVRRIESGEIKIPGFRVEMPVEGASLKKITVVNGVYTPEFSW